MQSAGLYGEVFRPLPLSISEASSLIASLPLPPQPAELRRHAVALGVSEHRLRSAIAAAGADRQAMKAALGLS